MATSRRTAQQTSRSSRGKGRSQASRRSSAQHRANGHGSHSSYSLGSTMRKAVSGGRDAVNTAYEKASEMTSSLPSMRDMRDMMPSTPRRLQRMANRNPMRLGAIGIGLGLLIGALVPFMMADQQSMFRMASGRSGGSHRQSQSRTSRRSRRKSQARSQARRSTSRSRSAAARLRSSSSSSATSERTTRSQRSRPASRASGRPAKSRRPTPIPATPTPPTAGRTQLSDRTANRTVNAAGRSET